MKKIFIVSLTLCIIIGLAFAFTMTGKWVFKEAAIVGHPVATDAGEAGINVKGFRNPYSVGVDPDGKVWAGTYYSRRFSSDWASPWIYPDLIEIYTATDTLEYWDKPIFILDPATGTVDTVRFLTHADGTADTISTHRGFARTPDGNMIMAGRYTINSGDTLAVEKKRLWKINYQTFEIMNSYDLPDDFSFARPAVDAEGFIYFTGLFGGTVTILDPDDWSAPYNSFAAEGTSVVRTMTVSADGKDVYLASYNGGAFHYYSADGVDGAYAFQDTLLKEVNGEKVVGNLVEWGPDSILWIGSYDDAGAHILYGLDPYDNYAIVDSLSFTFWAATAGTDTTTGGYAQPKYLRCPRDAAFSPDGKIFYFADFYSYTIKAFEFSEGTSVQTEIPLAPTQFELLQNYPNPFNPTTNITFSLDKLGAVELKVYDLNGREVATIINKQMSAGRHTVQFDGSHLSSGVYYYRLKANDQVLTKRMTLVK